MTKLRRSQNLAGRGGRGSPTLAEVAEIAGVSSATISRFLNVPELVSEKSAARVRDAIAQTGYVPNLIAGGLASNRSRLIATIVPALSHSIFGSVIQAMADELAETGYQVLLGTTGRSSPLSGTLLDSVLGRRPDGVILFPGTAEDPALRHRLGAAGTPIIEAWELPAEPIDMAVGFSQEAVGHEVARFVVEQGYRRPFLISANVPPAQLRKASFSHALAEFGIAEPPSVGFDTPTTFRQGRRGLAAFLDEGGEADIVVCSSDSGAHGAIVEAQARGLRVPEDLAVIGFADLDFAVDTEPSLTTVHIDGHAIGRQAASLLLQRARGIVPEHCIVDVGFSLVVRASA